MGVNPILLKLFNLFLILFSINLWCQKIVSEEVELKNGEIKLPGTLSYPELKEKTPLVIFVHGSGNIDRNGNQAGTQIKANYIKTLADSLNTKGIAFYRYDKRTSIITNLEKSKNITLLDFVKDVKTAIDYFSDDKRFGSIHIIGHSQGSLVGILSVTDEIDSYISIAGPSKTIDKTIITQLEKQNTEFAKTARKHFDELAQTDTIQQVNPLLMSIFAPQNHKFLANWMRLNPEEEIKKLDLPILILNGDADLQVSDENAEMLHKANPQSKLSIIPKMNHLLKEVNTMEENQKAYTDETIPLSQRLVKEIVNFVKNSS